MGDAALLLLDVVRELRERVEELDGDKSNVDDFVKGRVFGISECLELIKTQAVVFGVDGVRDAFEREV